MESDTKRMRGQRPVVFANLRDGTGVDAIAEFLTRLGGLRLTSVHLRRPSLQGSDVRRRFEIARLTL